MRYHPPIMNDAKYDIEIHNSRLTTMGLNSIIDFYRTLACREHQFPGAMAFVAGLDSPYFNTLFDTRTNRQNSAALVSAATNFFGEFQVPWGWFIMPADHHNDLADHGFDLTDDYPAMYFNLTDTLPDMQSEFITIREAGIDDDLSQWFLPVSAGFQVKEGDEGYRKLNADILHKGVNKLRHFMAYYQGQIAGAATLFISDDAVMLHNLATSPGFEGRGIGTTLTLYMLEIARQIGREHCFLDASDAAFRLYQKIGFKVYSSTLVYTKT